MEGIIVDNFAGGGGVSVGIEWATGRSVDAAINHDPEAIAMHKANHPATKHYCENIWEVDPVEVAAGRPVKLAWFSPDCKHHSKAKGGKPRDNKIRGLAWVAVRWARAVRPEVIILENVEEFKDWGPLTIDGMPDPERKGKTFMSFVNMLRRLGYKVDWQELKACDYGAPTIRKRFFLIARCDGRAIVWPEPTHGAPDTLEVLSGVKQPWIAAKEIIDWTRPCPSIFARKKPLAENTMRRIAKGLEKYVFKNPNPFIIKVNHTGSEGFRGQSIDEPFQTITSKNGWGVVTPAVVPFVSRQFGQSIGHSVNSPSGTITAEGGGKSQLVAAFLQEYLPEFKVEEIEVKDGGEDSITTSHLIKLRNNSIGSTVTEPVHTITSGGLHIGEVRAFLIKYYGADIGSTLDEPAHTVTTKDRFALVTVQGRLYQLVDIGMRMLEPRELFRAQGFPEDYIIERDAEGKPYPKAAQVARCGNSVPPPMVKALVRANLPYLCGKAIEKEAVNS